MFYMKEYGKKSHIHTVIVKESVKILILASLISSIGGFGIQSIESKFILIVPLIILLPALNDMVGDFGTMVSSSFTTSLYLGKVNKRWWKSENIHNMFKSKFKIALISALYVGVLSSIIAYAKGFSLTIDVALRVIGISITTTIVLFTIIFLISVIGGLIIYYREEDPNNFLIPITTSVADFGSLFIIYFLVGVFF